jgi:hypothetical protein
LTREEIEKLVDDIFTILGWFAKVLTVATIQALWGWTGTIVLLSLPFVFGLLVLLLRRLRGTAKVATENGA